MNYNNYGYTNGYMYPQNIGMSYPQNGNFQQTTQIQSQQSANELMVVMVDDEQAVQNYPVAMGTSVMLMDYQNRKFWIKSMTNGVTPSITEHEFKVVSGDSNNSGSNVTRDEFDALSENVSKLQKIIEDLNS